MVTLDSLTTGSASAAPLFPKRAILPPVRKLFRPDPGMLICDADLIGAEAALVAYEAGGKYKSDILSGVKIHRATMEYLYNAQFLIKPDHEPQYTKCKNMAYGTTYAGGARGIAQTASIPEHLVRAFQPWFFGRYPGIREWHHRAEVELYEKRTASNAFGFRIYYFDRPEGLLPKALAWRPQSTIAIVTQRGQRLLRREFPDVQLLLQVHDSVVFQIARSRAERLRLVIERLNSAEELRVPFPDDSLQIKWDVKVSRTSWGDCKKLDLDSMRCYTEQPDRTRLYEDL
jgi:DNA polymerase I